MGRGSRCRHILSQQHTPLDEGQVILEHVCIVLCLGLADLPLWPGSKVGRAPSLGPLFYLLYHLLPSGNISEFQFLYL